MVDFRVDGADKLARVAKELRTAGDKGLSKELYAGLNRATKPLREEAKASADANLPRRGGLNTLVARKRFSTRRRGGRYAGVIITAKGLDQLRRMDEQGKVRHPVYGRRTRWVDQRIPQAQGWFTEPMQAGAKTVRKELVKVIDEVSKKLAKKY